jgi:hypothetical protein
MMASGNLRRDSLFLLFALMLILSILFSAAPVHAQAAAPVQYQATSGGGSTAPLAASTYEAAIWTDKPDYAPGELVTIYGEGFNPGASVTIVVTRPDGSVNPPAWSVVADAFGNFMATYQLDGKAGTYRVEATDGTNTATTTFTDPPKSNLDQCANDSPFSTSNFNTQCGTTASQKWQNGDINPTNSYYREGDGVPYRLALTGLVNGIHTVKLGYDFTKGGKFAIDRLTVFNLTQKSNPCADTTQVACNLNDVILSPTDIPGEVAAPSGTQPALPNGGSLFTFTSVTILAHLNDIPNSRKMAAWITTSTAGETFTWGSLDTYVVQTGLATGDSSRSFSFNFTVGSCPKKGCDVMFAWTGHIASSETTTDGGWGAGNGAKSIRGAPFHMMLVSVDGGGGSQDRSVQLGGEEKITIVKNTVGGDGTFNFTTTGDDGFPSTFSITTSNGTGRQTFKVNAGGYNVTESGPDAPWGFTSLNCTSGGSVSGQMAMFTLPAGGDVTCTFTDTKVGSIVIRKVALGGDAAFNFTATGGLKSPFSITTSSGSGNSTFSNLPPGVYNVTESGPSLPWAFTSLSCSPTQSIFGQKAQITLTAGQTVTCTYTDTKGITGTLTVVKKIVNDNGGNATLASFLPLQVGGTTVVNGSATGFNAGTYTVSETSVTGYVATFSGDCDSSTHQVTLSVGDSKTCTITNNDVAPTLRIVKTVINDNGGNKVVADFPLRINGTQSVTNGTVNTLTANRLQTVSETQLTGYTASVWGGDCSAAGTITLLPGDVKTCTITNDDVQPKLTVVKKIVNDNGGNATLASFLPLQVGGTTVVNGSATGFNAGTYTVSETSVTGYVATFSGDCDSGGSVTLAVGSPDKSCIITNDDDPVVLTVNKVLVPSTDAGKFNLQIDGVTKATDVGDGGTTGAVILSIGPHTVSELAGTGTVLADYTVVIGGDCASDGTITLAAGDQKTCTITNTKLGHIIVDKVTVPAGDSQSFSFTTTGSGYAGFSLTDAATPHDSGALVPGTYSVAETVPTGWTLTGLSCKLTVSGSATSTWSTTAPKATISVGAGDTATCTFTDTKAQVTTTTTTTQVTTTIIRGGGGGGGITDPTCTVTEWIIPTNVDGASMQNIPYQNGEDVYVKGSGFSPYTTVRVYLVNATEDYIVKNAIAHIEAKVDGNGRFGPIKIWQVDRHGGFNVWADVNRSGKYDSCTDVVNSALAGESSVIAAPEFSEFIVLLMTVLIMSANAIMRRRLKTYAREAAKQH